MVMSSCLIGIQKLLKGTRTNMPTYYKLARPNGFDFHTGNTVNYRNAIGGTVTAPDYLHTARCGHGLHYCANPNDCFIGASIPCSAYEVRPVGSRHKPIDGQKSKTETLAVLREITDLDTLFGWRYSEAINPINPLKINRGPVTPAEIDLLHQWASVANSVGDSIGDSLGDSLGDSIGASVANSIWNSVANSIWNSIWNSIRNSVWAYIGSLFPNITHWKYVNHTPDVYPFQSAADLWRAGLLPSFDGRTWQLHAGLDAAIVYEERI